MKNHTRENVSNHTIYVASKCTCVCASILIECQSRWSRVN